MEHTISVIHGAYIITILSSKIAYGTSFGHDSFRGSSENKRKAGFYLERFNAVSVREKYAVDLCKNDFGVDATEVLDPVFLCDKKHYEACIAESNLTKNPPARKYVLAYILDPTEKKQQAIEAEANRLDADIVCIPNANVDQTMRENWRLPIKENIDMEDWLCYFKNAEAVVTDSFHGMCFSIIFRRRFVAIGNKRRGIARFAALLDKFGLTDRFVMSADEIAEKSELLEPIDYLAVYEKIDTLRAESLAGLDAALAAEPSQKNLTAYDLLDKRIDETSARIKAASDDFDKRMADFAAKLTRLDDISAKLTQLDTMSERLADLDGLLTLISSKKYIKKHITKSKKK